MLLYEKAAEQLRMNIKEGIYAFRKFPSEKELAEQMGVSGITARRAIQELVNKNILERQENGRPTIVQNKSKFANRTIAWLMPAFSSASFPRIFSYFHPLVANDDTITVRIVNYHHWNDGLLWDTLTGFDGAFIISLSENIPDEFIEKVNSLPRPPVFVGADLVEHGLPSILMYPPVWTQRVLDHLAGQGHRNIACVNVQPMDRDVAARIGQWKLWMAARGFTGTLINEPVESYVSPMSVARDVVARAYANGLDATALLCITLPAAIGAYRVLYERGEKPGNKVAVATVDGEGTAAILAPSLTCLAEANITPYFKMCLDWMRSRGPWEGPLLLRPEESVLEIGESSRNCRKTPALLQV